MTSDKTNSGLHVDGEVNVNHDDRVGRDMVVHGDKVMGDKVMGNKITHITEEQSYDVTNLPNPYFGLKPFTYEDREAYAGRARLVRKTVDQLTAYGHELNLFFITGASGSGKSSFAQAGVLPALEHHYKEYGQKVEFAVVRPGPRPLLALDSELRRLKIGALRLAELPPGDRNAAFAQHLCEDTPSEQVNVIILDQFEELFTQSDPAEREGVFSLLYALPAFREARTHIIATIRIDYWGELHRAGNRGQEEGLFEIAQHNGVALHVMGAEELRASIQQPLNVWMKQYPQYGARQFEPKLLMQLADDAGTDEALLPLLQVALRELWHKGSLRLAAYDGLVGSIQRHAENVCSFADWSEPLPAQERPAQDQDAILEIALALVNVSPGNDSRHDTRIGRLKQQLVGDSDVRSKLVESMIEARMVSVSGEGEAQVVNIIHESLINNWERLRQKIGAERQKLQMRARFEQQLALWKSDGKEHPEDYLLTRFQLSEANALAAAGDIALQNDDARRLLHLSNERAAEELERVNAEKAQLQQALAESTSRQLAAVALNQADADRERAILIALKANAAKETAESREALVKLLEPLGSRRRLEHKAGVLRTVVSPDEARIASVDAELTLSVWNVADGALVFAVPAHAARVTALDWSSDGRFLLTAAWDGSVRVWDAMHGVICHMYCANSLGIYQARWSPTAPHIASAHADYQVRLWDARQNTLLHTLTGHSAEVIAVDWSPDGSHLVTADLNGVAHVWGTGEGALVHTLKGHTGLLLGAAWAPDGMRIATFGDDKTVRIWSASAALEQVLAGHQDGVVAVRWSPDSSRLATWCADVLNTNDRVVRIWDVGTGRLVSGLASHTARVRDACWSPDGNALVTVGDDHIVNIWEVETGSRVNVIRDHQQSINEVNWLRNTKMLVTAGMDKAVILQTALTGDLVEVARAQAADRQLSYEERVRYLGQPEKLSALGEAMCQLLPGRFNLEDLVDLCFALGDAASRRGISGVPDVDNLPGGTLSAKITELVWYFERHGLTRFLAEEIILCRPDIQLPLNRIDSDYAPVVLRTAAQAPAAHDANDPGYRGHSALAGLIMNYYSTGEIREMAFDLRIPWHRLRGRTTQAKVIALLEYCAAHDKEMELELYLRRSRPNLVDQLAQLPSTSHFAEFDMLRPEHAAQLLMSERLNSLVANIRILDLQEIASAFGLDWDEIRGYAKPQKLRSLVATCAVRGMLAHLVQQLNLRAGEETLLDVDLFAGIEEWEPPYNPFSALPGSARELAQVLFKYFNLDDVRNVAFDLEVMFDDLPGEIKSEKILGLVMRFVERNELPRLRAFLIRTYPDLAGDIHGIIEDGTP